MTSTYFAAEHRALSTALLAAADALHTAGSALLAAMQNAAKVWDVIGVADDLHFRLIDLSEQVCPPADVIQLRPR